MYACVCDACDQHATRTARAPVRTATAPSAVTSVDLTLWQSPAELKEHVLVRPIIILLLFDTVLRKISQSSYFHLVQPGL